jgi:nuclease HARBI1
MPVCQLLWEKVKEKGLLEGTYEKIILKNRNYVHFETGFLLCLYRLARPRRIHPDITRKFGMSSSKVSIAINTFMKAFHFLSLPYFSEPLIWANRMPYYAELIKNKTNGLVDFIWAFIDGTIRRTCRPKYFQKQAYSGHKRFHGIKFQSVLCPDGMVALLYGPVAGSRHDSFMLNESGILPKLRELMPEGGDKKVYSIYGDPAYPQSNYILGGFRNVEHQSIEGKWNTCM